MEISVHFFFLINANVYVSLNVTAGYGKDNEWMVNLYYFEKLQTLLLVAAESALTGVDLR